MPGPAEGTASKQVSLQKHPERRKEAVIFFIAVYSTRGNSRSCGRPLKDVRKAVRMPPT